MNIKSMTATFGRLEDRTLALQPGLNVITGGNESGKSTWAEFLLSMFYGVDTKARSKAGQLPTKTKYQPWSGKPMRGAVELERHGQHLLLERSSDHGPMTTLRVRDAESGTRVPELENDSCGVQLLGVEAEVFQRSGFFRQRQLFVSSDPQLEKRLSGLVSSGAEDYAYGELDGKLKKLQNAVAYHQTGLLPEAQAELERLETVLRNAEALQSRRNQLYAKIRIQREEIDKLEELSEKVSQMERQSHQNAIAVCREALRQAEEDRAAWEEVCRELPRQEKLDELSRRLQALKQDSQTASLEDGLDPIRLPEPPEDPAFDRLNAQQAEEKAKQDSDYVIEAWSKRSPGLGALLLWLLPGMAALGLGALLYFGQGQASPLLSGILILLGCLGIGAALFFWQKRSHAVKLSRQAAQNILNRYEVKDPDGILWRGSAYSAAWKAYEAQHSAAEEALRVRVRQSEALNRRKEALLSDFRVFTPDCDSLLQAEIFLQEAASSLNALAQAGRMALQRRAALEKLGPESEPVSEPTEDLSAYRAYNPAEIRSRLSQKRSELVDLRSEADRLGGALEQLGDPMLLHQKKEQTQQRILALQQRFTALGLARKALERADTEVRSRFSPLLCQRAGALFSLLTEGKYDRVRLDRELHVTVHPAGATADRPLSYLSGGTVDQLYLALRLAICELLMPEAPIILDDALAYFDDQRAKLALRVLRQLGKHRQILLFTCQSREKQLLDEEIQAASDRESSSR